MGGGITYARGEVESPYGKIECGWKISDGEFMLEISVPVGTDCIVSLPNGEKQTVGSGKYEFKCKAENFVK